MSGLYVLGILTGILIAFLYKGTLLGRTGSFCNGTAELSDARSKERSTAFMGEGKRLPSEGIFCHFNSNDRGMVFAEF